MDRIKARYDVANRNKAVQYRDSLVDKITDLELPCIFLAAVFVFLGFQVHLLFHGPVAIQLKIYMANLQELTPCMQKMPTDVLILIPK